MRYYDRTLRQVARQRRDRVVNRYKKLVPVIALILVAAGVSLDRYGIDLEALARGESPFGQATTTEPSASGANATLAPAPERTGGTDPYVHSSDKWSSTQPNINLQHIFHGEINRSGEPTGYHSRPGGIDADSARVVSIRDTPNRLGVYTATIEVRDGSQWKQKFSSFFPDAFSGTEVVTAILHAYEHREKGRNQPWQGPSGHGFQIQGYTSSRGGINTAFPVYVRNP